MWGLTLAFLIILSIGLSYLKLSRERKEDYGPPCSVYYGTSIELASLFLSICWLLYVDYYLHFFDLNDIMRILTVSLLLLLSKFFTHLIVFAILFLQLGCTYEVILAYRRKLTLLNLLELSTSNCGYNRIAMTGKMW